MFHELTGTEHANANAAEQVIDGSVADVLLSSDDSELLLDNRSLNGKDADVKYGDFYEAMGKYFDRQLLQVQERRHGTELYLPLAISVVI